MKKETQSCYKSFANIAKPREQRTPEQILDADIARTAHWREQRRRAVEPEPEMIRHSDPVCTMPAPAAIEPPEDYRDELLVYVIAELQNDFDRKLAVLRNEIHELRSIGLADLRGELRRSVQLMGELVDRLKREPSTVIDLPPLPRRTGRDVN